jgi:hypothetical protein
MTKQTEQIENTLFLQEWISSVDPSSGELPDVETAALDFASQIEGREAQLTALGGLIGQVQHKSDRLLQLIQDREDAKFGTGIAEINLKDLGTGTDRLLQAKNPAIVIRNGMYSDFKTEITGAITTNTGLIQVRQTLFPSSGMIAEDSKLHLDNFIASQDPGFRYSLTAARVTQGSVLFVAGFASKAAQKLSSTGYAQKQQAINSNPIVDRLFNDARLTGDMTTRRFDVEELNTELSCVSLHEGDVVVWPQGGPASEAPVWHSVRQLGKPDSPDFVPRKTVSYHFE